MARQNIPLRDRLSGNELPADLLNKVLWNKTNGAVERDLTDNPVALDRIREYEALYAIRKRTDVEVLYNEFKRLENGKGRLLTGQLGVAIVKFYIVD